MGMIDAIGTFIGEIVEAGVNVTKTGKPQFVGRFKALKKYITDAADLAHFQMTEPGYVDWSSFSEDIVAFLLLFNSSTEFSKETQMLNYEQLQIATGWDGLSFDALGDGSMIGKQILFRVQDKKPYTNDAGKTIGEGQLEVSWIDAPDAAPERQLKTIDASAVAGLNSLLKINKAAAPAKPVAAAKPAAKPAATKPGKSTPAVAPTPPAASPTAAPAVATTAPASTSTSGPATPPQASTPTTSPSKAPSKPKATKPAPAPVVEETPADETPALPTETTQDIAWAFVVTNKGDNDDATVQDAWIAACQEVGGDRDEDNFTGTDWAKVRDTVRRDLSL